MTRFCLLLCLLPFVLHGQEARPVDVGVRALALDRTLELPERYLKTAEGFELLPISNRQPGERIETRSAGRIALYRKSVGEHDEEAFDLAEQVVVPEGAKSILLLVWQTQEGIRFLPVDDNFAGAGYDDWLMINTTSKAIGFRIGEATDPFFLKPNSIETCKIAAPKDAGTPVIGRIRSNGKIKTFYSTYWPVRSGERSLVLFVEQNNRIRVEKISDALLDKTGEGR